MRHKTAFLAGLALLVCSTSVFALGPRTFVASNGLDSNTCGRTDPCRSFAAALLQTTINGEVVALDSAGYGVVTITQGVSIISPLGVHAAITASVGDGVTINAVNAFATVTLRNLYINSGGGSNGITFNSGGQLHIENCVISNFSHDGIQLIPTNDAKVYISDTVVRDDSSAGIYADSASALNVSVDHCRIEHDGFGLLADHAIVAASNSTADGNTAAGFQARGSISGAAVMAVESCVASFNNTGFLANAGCGLVVHNSTALKNDTGYYALGGDLSMDNCVAMANINGVDVDAGTGTIKASTFTRNTGIAVRIENFGFAVVSRNTITTNGTGIDCTGGTAHTTGDNTLENNATNLTCVPTAANQV
jgi:hypothetical protein